MGAEYAPLKVAYVIGRYCPGGIVSYASCYAHSLEDKGITVDFFIDESEVDSDIVFKGCRGRVFMMPTLKNPFRYMKEYRKAFRSGKYDIVHGFLNTLNPFCMIAAKKAGIPVRIAENLSTGHFAEKKTIIKNALKPFSCVGSTAHAANSELAGKWLYGKEAIDDCILLYNPVDTAAFFFSESIRNAMRKEMGWNDSFVVGCIARFEIQKNHTKLLEVFGELLKIRDDARLVLIGHGSLETRIREQIALAGLTDHVDFLDPTINLNSAYNAFDVLALTSLYEGMPMVAVEAQATGLACVLSSEITRECAISERVEFVKLQESSRAWAHCIVRCGFLNDRARYSRAFTGSKYDSLIAVDELYRNYVSLVSLSAGEKDAR